MDIAPSCEHSAVAFYGIRPSESAAERYYEIILSWLINIGCRPDKLAISRKGHSGSQVSFSAADTRLRKAGFADVTAISITSMAPSGRFPTRDYLATSTYSSGETPYCYLATSSSLAVLSQNSFLTVARVLALELQPDYGIGYTREQRLGPALYAIGLCTGLDTISADREEALNITRWADTGMPKGVYNIGLLRDIYNWNFINSSQLNYMIGNISLYNWIMCDSTHGKLTSFSDNLLLWEVDPSNLVNVRRVLWEAGIIFNWKMDTT
jgi:hypothetical protein